MSQGLQPSVLHTVHFCFYNNSPGCISAVSLSLSVRHLTLLAVLLRSLWRTWPINYQHFFSLLHCSCFLLHIGLVGTGLLTKAIFLRQVVWNEDDLASSPTFCSIENYGKCTAPVQLYFGSSTDLGELPYVSKIKLPYLLYSSWLCFSIECNSKVNESISFC